MPIEKLCRAFPARTDPVWRPLVDVCRTRTGWLLKFDLAGVRLQDVAVAVGGRRVAVTGCRRDWVVEEASSYYSMEISYNRFERVIDMPCELDRARVQLDARDGLLLVRIVMEGNEQNG